MSFDPTGYSPDEPPRSDIPPMGSPPPSEQAANLGGGQGDVRNRVQLPAMFLILAGALNLIGAIGGFIFGGVYAALPPAQIEEMVKQQDPQAYQQMKQQGMDIKSFINIYIYGGFGFGCAGLFSALLSILGGVCMLRLRGFALAVFGAIVTAIPGVSPSACCALGLIAGIWALVVLMAPDVRAAFR